MMQAAQCFKRLKFGVFEADSRTGELTRKRIRLLEQPFPLLVLLLDRPGEPVTRDELHGKLRPETIVDFDHGLYRRPTLPLVNDDLQRGLEPMAEISRELNVEAAAPLPIFPHRFLCPS